MFRFNIHLPTPHFQDLADLAPVDAWLVSLWFDT
jgi:hypothetical protein